MDKVLKGRLSVDRSLRGKLTSGSTLRGVIITSYERNHYRGEHVIVPKAQTEQILETANKIVDQNITVKKVPYYETSNDYGETVYICSEV